MKKNVQKKGLNILLYCNTYSVKHYHRIFFEKYKKAKDDAPPPIIKNNYDVRNKLIEKFIYYP